MNTGKKKAPTHRVFNDVSGLFTWSWWPDLNRRPADYESAALPTELHQHSCAATIIIIAQLRGAVKRFFEVFLFQSFRM